ncbi:MAG: phytanoyl-CoA dioxygenase family protein [Nocardia sp.]|uniref:phytanoyl-CoA dioxygenase family protein n=1 Tax=Nocardia sp. TaxID=1821 RepID=UPI002639A001|nr:phytanoyl-CoA dioxygenase family protein [Nocardia sp.]MCU1644037.1 phytanoyl-CoA dioxygenase family protein [Nocardia sp.]
MSLSAAQKVAFRHDGCLVLDRVLTEQQLRRMNELIDSMVEQSAETTTNTAMYDLESDHRAQQPRVRGLRDPLAVDPLFTEISVSDAVLDPIEDLLGPDLRRELAFVNIKPPGSGPLQPHQDFAILPYTNDCLVVCGLALTDSTVANGCLHVLPGSHRRPILEHHQDGVMIGAIQADDPEFDTARMVPVEVPAGGMSIHHFRTVHGSPPNTSAGDRRVFWLDYAAEDTYPIGKPVDLQEFAQRMVRGTHTRQVRTLALEFPMPNRARRAKVLVHLQDGLASPLYPHPEAQRHGQ